MQFEYSQASIYRQIRIKESNNEPQGPKTGRDDSRTSQMGIIKSSFRTVVFFFSIKQILWWNVQGDRVLTVPTSKGFVQQQKAKMLVVTFLDFMLF